MNQAKRNCSKMLLKVEIRNSTELSYVLLRKADDRRYDENRYLCY